MSRSSLKGASVGNEQVEPASSTFPMNQGFKCCYHCSWSGCTDAKAASEADGSRLVSELVLCMVPLVKFGDQKTSKLCSNSPNDPSKDCNWSSMYRCKSNQAETDGFRFVSQLVLCWLAQVWESKGFQVMLKLSAENKGNGEKKGTTLRLPDHEQWTFSDGMLQYFSFFLGAVYYIACHYSWYNKISINTLGNNTTCTRGLHNGRTENSSR